MDMFQATSLSHPKLKFVFYSIDEHRCIINFAMVVHVSLDTMYGVPVTLFSVVVYHQQKQWGLIRNLVIHQDSLYSIKQVLRE